MDIKKILNGDAGAKKSAIHQVTLQAHNWIGDEKPFRYALTIEGVTIDTNYDVTNSTNPIMTDEEVNAFSNAKIVCDDNTENTINFVAYGIKPEINIPIKIIVRGD